MTDITKPITFGQVVYYPPADPMRKFAGLYDKAGAFVGNVCRDRNGEMVFYGTQWYSPIGADILESIAICLRSLGPSDALRGE